MTIRREPRPRPSKENNQNPLGQAEHQRLRRVTNWSEQAERAHYKATVLAGLCGVSLRQLIEQGCLTKSAAAEVRFRKVYGHPPQFFAPSPKE